MSQQLLESVAFKLDTDEGLFLSGQVYTIRDDVPKQVLILGHGFRGHKDWSFWPDIANRFAERGYYTVAFNFTRIAAAELGQDEQSQAQASTLTQELRDWESVVTALLEGRLPLAAQADRSRLAILGHSRAGGTAILYASEHPEIRAVAVWNGGGTPGRLLQSAEGSLTVKEQAILHDLQHNADRYQTGNSFKRLTIPAIVVQGDSDSEGLLAVNRELRALAPSQTFVSISGGDHTFGASEPFAGTTAALDQAFEETVRFLNGAFL